MWGAPLFTRLCLTLLAGALLRANLLAQSPENRNLPIPDVPSMLRDVESHQRALDALRENYTYRELEKTNDLDSVGKVKKTETREDEIFFVNSHQIARLIAKDGKPLSPDQQRKEQDRVNKDVEKALRVPPGTPLDREAVSVSRLLKIIKVSNPRRLDVNGRRTIVFNFVGDPHAKTHGIGEDLSKKVSGTVWIDEKDRQVARLEARFDENFRMGAGLLASVEKGTTVVFVQALVNPELWLPAAVEIHLDARLLLLKGIRQDISFQDSDYRQFRTDAIQAGATVANQPK